MFYPRIAATSLPVLQPSQLMPTCIPLGRWIVSAARQVTDSEGKELQDSVTGRGGGYRYFGAAKSLPGVRELFEKEPPKKVLPGR